MDRTQLVANKERRKIATQVMCSFAACFNAHSGDGKRFAKEAVAWADELIAELDRKKKS